MASRTSTSTLQVRFEVDGDGKVVRAFTGVGTSADRASRDIDQFNDRTDKLISNAKLAGAAVGTALAGGLIALGGAVKNSIDFADQLNDINQRLGISAETLGGWSYAAQQTGTDIAALGDGMKVLARNMTAALDPKSQQAGLFKALGIDVVDATGKLRKLEDLVPELADSFKGLKDETLEAALAQELMGRNGLAMVEFLNQGSDGLATMQERAAELGFTLTEEALAAADEFNDGLGDLQTVSQGLTMQLAQALLPTLNDLVAELVELAKDGSTAADVGRDVGNAVEFFAAVISRAYAQVDGFGKIIEGLAAGLVELNGASSALMSGNFAGAMEILSGRNSNADALIGQGAAQLLSGQRAGAQSSAVKVNFAGRDPEPAGLFQKSAGEVRAEQRAADVEKRLQEFLKNRSGSSGAKRSGMSDAEREARAIDAAYASLNERLREEIALFGQTGEAAKVRYQIEQEDLSKLTAAQRESVKAKQEEALVNAERLDQMEREKELRDEAAKLAEQEAETRQRNLEATQALIADMEFELALLGMTNKERERAIALRNAEANGATPEQTARIMELATAQQQAAEMAGVLDHAQRSLADAFYDVATGASSAEDIAKGFFDSMAQYVTRMIAESWAESIVGLFRPSGNGGGSNLPGQGEASGGGGWMQMAANIFGSLFGGGRATGGGVSGGRMGRMYEVNEWGTPELLNVAGRQLLMMPPGSSGTVQPTTPARGGASYGDTNINVSVQGGVDRRTRMHIANDLQRELARGGRNR